MKKGIIALASGTFGLGITEYVMMSILPELASTFHCSIPEAGYLISIYAIGVCVGAVAVAIFLRNWPLKRILLALMAIYTIGNLTFACSHTFALGLASRFFTGLPHGAFFGAGSIVASRLMPDKAATAVSLMTLGMTVANLVGIPLGGFIANTFNWRWIFVFNALWGLVTMGAIATLIHNIGALPHSGIKEEFRFMRNPAPWILVGATILCQGGGFSMYSYVTPIMEQAGMSIKSIPLLMIAVGAGMCLGNYSSGVFSDRRTPETAALCDTILMTCALITAYFVASDMWASSATTILVATSLFALSSPMQLMLIKYSPGGELMGGAMVQVAFNFGNAVGAYLGGLPISAGMPAATSALVGASLAALSIITVIYFRRKIRTA